MNDKILRLFDNQQYKEVIWLTNPYKTENIWQFELLYYLKSTLACNDFNINEVQEVKKLLFYYFYLLWEVQFDNWYTFRFRKEMYKISFSHFDTDIQFIKWYKDYFDFWKNEVFLNKIIDTSNGKKIWEWQKWVIETDNIVDYFLYFTYECSELYTFKWEHFPLFKWLINELT